MQNLHGFIAKVCEQLTRHLVSEESPKMDSETIYWFGFLSSVPPRLEFANAVVVLSMPIECYNKVVDCQRTSFHWNRWRRFTTKINLCGRWRESGKGFMYLIDGRGQKCLQQLILGLQWVFGYGLSEAMQVIWLSSGCNFLGLYAFSYFWSSKFNFLERSRSQLTLSIHTAPC